MGDIHIRIDEEPIIIRMEAASIYPIPFISLTDVPTTYHDQANKFVKVKAAEDGLEFTLGSYTLPIATSSILGGVKEGSGVTIGVDGTISAAGTYTLPIATGTVLGGIKVGSRLTIDPATGILDADVQTSSMTYPDAGIPLSTGTAWGTSIINNSGNWNTAYGWGNHAGLYLPISGAGDIYTHNASEFALTAHNHSGTYEVPLTFGSGVTRTVNAVANDLITGKAGGQSIYGDTASGGNLILSSTFHGTKGKIQIGTSYYDEVNNRLGLGVTTPLATLDFKAGSASANTAPIRLASGPVETTARVGLIEFLTDDLYFTITTGAARKKFIFNDGTNLTSGRIPVAFTNGRLNDFAGLTYSDTTGLATTKNVTLSAGNLTLAALASVSNKLGVIDTSGQVVAGGTVLEALISDGTAIGLLIDTANWTLGIYGGTALTNVYAGQHYYDDNYKYEMMTDSYPIRLPRA